MAYASVGTGYKAGGVGPRPFNAQQAIGFGPETLISYELGLKTDLFDRKVRVQHGRLLQRLQGCTAGAPELPAIRRAGALRAAPERRRREASKAWKPKSWRCPVAGLQFDLSGSYLHWDWKCVNPEVVGLPRTAVLERSGGDRPLVLDPDRIHQGAGARRHPVRVSSGQRRHPDAAPGCHLPGSAERQQSGGRGGHAVRPLRSGAAAYTVANAHLEWKNAEEGPEATLEATNIFNKYYFYSKFDLTRPVPEPSPARPPRRSPGPLTREEDLLIDYPGQAEKRRGEP